MIRSSSSFKVQLRISRLATPLMVLLAVPAIALAPPPPCSLIEANMYVSYQGVLGGEVSGMVVEAYSDPSDAVENGVYVYRQASIPQLHAFRGVRVTNCATGQFLAIPDVGVSEVSAALEATEFLRDDVQNGRPVSWRDVIRAAEALYDNVGLFRETEETCGCGWLAPDARPAGMTPFDQRTDVD